MITHSCSHVHVHICCQAALSGRPKGSCTTRKAWLSSQKARKTSVQKKSIFNHVESKHNTFSRAVLSGTSNVRGFRICFCFSISGSLAVVLIGDHFTQGHSVVSCLRINLFASSPPFFTLLILSRHSKHFFKIRQFKTAYDTPL